MQLKTIHEASHRRKAREILYKRRDDPPDLTSVGMRGEAGAWWNVFRDVVFAPASLNSVLAARNYSVPFNFGGS